jgi:alkanesulfonate monooxygenase SsuD/methylene tetrahydromethanopterin reductase-like flavin-dependent oxidoreductase (luciferase family)
LAWGRQTACVGVDRADGRRLGAVVPELVRRVDEGAEAAGRDPGEIRRVYNIGGTIADAPAQALLQGPPEHWIETLRNFAEELGFDTFIFWPGEDPQGQLERFAQEIVPALRAPS